MKGLGRSLLGIGRYQISGGWSISGPASLALPHWCRPQGAHIPFPPSVAATVVVVIVVVRAQPPPVTVSRGGPASCGYHCLSLLLVTPTTYLTCCHHTLSYPKHYQLPHPPHTATCNNSRYLINNIRYIYIIYCILLSCSLITTCHASSS